MGRTGKSSMKSTSSVSEILPDTIEQLTTGVNKSKPTDNCTVVEADELFTHLSDLVNEQFKAWYCRQFYRLNKIKVLELAAQAKADGKDPKRLFSFLLKNV